LVERQAPLLFPIVGWVLDDHILAGGQKYPMRQHGLARISDFTLIRASGEDCVFSLDSSQATHVHYPFDFRLEVTYALNGPSLSLSARVTNPGPRPMPVSFGFHPAFRWPLPGAADKGAHTVIFDEAEPAPVRRLNNGLLMPELFPTPVAGRALALRDSLFAGDALVFDQLVSRAVTYRSPLPPCESPFPACRISESGRNPAPASSVSNPGTATPPRKDFWANLRKNRGV
jgi:galactose mutarotase-like enzyme